MAETATILHADLDAFYASVEQLLDPSLRGKPIAVGGGVVLAASYEAKAFGVRGGMPGRQARQLCPELRFVGGHFEEYVGIGDEVMEILRSYTPLIERISIDEAFLDVSGSVHLFGPPSEIASRIRRRVWAEVGLPISVGVARTKHLAKIASQVAKPDGLVVVEPERETEFLHPLPVDLMWGVGPVTRRRLAERGIITIGDLAETPGESLERLLGRAVGGRLGALAWNEDPRRVETQRRAASVSAQSALGRREVSDELVQRTVRHLTDRVATRLRAKRRAGRTITVRVRFEDLEAITRSVTLPVAVAVTPIIAAVAEDLIRSALTVHAEERIITLLSVGVSHLEYEEALQLELPLDLGEGGLRPGTEKGSECWALDKAVDKVREKFGRSSVGYASVILTDDRSVPDQFRELAER